MLYYILQHIFKYLDNVDRICLSLVCKKWFEERSRYLLFDAKLLAVKNLHFYDKESTAFKMISYRDQVIKSFQLTEEESLKVSKEEAGDRSAETHHIIITSDNIDSSISVDAYHWEFGKKFNVLIRPGQIPFTVTRITFGRNFNQTIEAGVLPQTLKRLEFGHDFNRSLDQISLPSGLKELVFGISFNQPIKPNSLPASLESLTFGEHFNQPLHPNSLPANLKLLAFGFIYNKPIGPDVLPKQLKTLIFGNSFNQPLPESLIPKSVRHLELGWNFTNSTLSIPDTVTTIDVCGGYFFETKRWQNEFPPNACVTVKMHYHNFQLRKFNDESVLVLSECLEGGFITISQLQSIEKIYKELLL